MGEATLGTKELAAQAQQNEKKLKEHVDFLSGSSRRDRQASASVLSQVARQKPELLREHVDAFVDALNRPEAQTRWEALEVLCALVSYDSRACDKAIVGAEFALFDEDSGLVRLSAMRFLCTLGATTANRSEKVWPLIEEAIQCYHGDVEFQDMLAAVLDYASGKLSPTVKAKLAERLRFDAENNKGALQKRAKQIIDAL